MDDDIENDGLFAVPAFATGGRVERTGIALVHEGEFIVPQPGSEAQISPWPAGDGAVVNYYFPVRIEVVGSLPDAEVQRVAGYVFSELDRELATRV
ncbi:hypothetical protein QMK19_18065 [Streptomyces sp. H10-C2]|uniref:hypothetical protein n=1 Tax=unclassified Streptomyces TaxID=2593676 RepID=UPI0024BA5318|nr:MULTISPECIES: hypothetical protein [unclassified Streptomyces]MDJ0343458.1 hypothetical protein [Streptomyces sp. PH10-H1]MDJ0371538.1 hypothetical protein [Streptomyces sp. H10-C2]